MDYNHDIKYILINFANRLSNCDYIDFKNKIPSGLTGIQDKFDCADYIGIMKYCKKENNCVYTTVAAGIIHKQLFINFFNFIDGINIKNNRPLVFTFKSLKMAQNKYFPAADLLTLLTPNTKDAFETFKDSLRTFVRNKLSDTYAYEPSNFQGRYEQFYNADVIEFQMDTETFMKKYNPFFKKTQGLS